MHCKNGTRTAFQIRHSSLDVRLHFVCGKGSDAMPPLPACMEHVSTPISQGTSWFWNENESTKYCYWSHPSCFVSEYLSKGTKRAKMCSAVNVVPCQARLSLVERAYSCYVHAPTLCFRSDIHNDKYTLTLFIFYVLQYSEHLFRYLVVAALFCSQMVWMNCVRYRHQVRARGCPS